MTKVDQTDGGQTKLKVGGFVSSSSRMIAPSVKGDDTQPNSTRAVRTDLCMSRAWLLENGR